MTPVQGGARADLALSPKGQIGPSLAISWGQRASSTAQWTLDVYVKTDEGKVFLGTVRPLPPVAGIHPSRIVAIANVPGARGWDVELQGPANESAEIGLSCSECCSGEPGLVDLDAFGRPQSAGGRLFLATPGLSQFRVFANRPGALWEVHGFQESGALGYVQLFDASAIPANGAVPRDSIRVPDGADFSWSSPTFRPLPFAVGIVAALSTTPDTLTLGPAALWAAAWVD